MIQNTIPTAQELRQLEDNTGFHTNPSPNITELIQQAEINLLGFMLHGHATKSISGLYGQFELTPDMIPFLEEKGYKITEIETKNHFNQKTYKVEW